MDGSKHLHNMAQAVLERQEKNIQTHQETMSSRQKSISFQWTGFNQ